MANNNNNNEGVEMLFSDAGPFDEESVAKSLKPHVTIHTADHRIYLKEDSLSSAEKVLAYGLAKKLLAHREFIENEEFTAKEIDQNTGMKRGTIDPTFKKLREKGMIVGRKGDYIIPNMKVNDISEQLSQVSHDK